MEVIHTIPPVYNQLRKKFGVNIDWDKGVIITYGGQIYSKYDIDQFKMAHEMTHVRQQRDYKPEEYLQKFVSQPLFRFRMELEAYQNEVKRIREVINHGKQRFEMISQIAKDLSQKYGFSISYNEALNLFS